MQRQSSPPRQIKALHKIKFPYKVKGFLRLRRQRFPMGMIENQWLHNSPFAVGKGDCRHLRMPSNLRQ